MKNLLPHLQLLDDRQTEMVDQVVDLCNTNSGTRNLAGLAAIKHKLVDYFACLGGELKLIDCQEDQIVDPKGDLVSAPLGQSIHIVKRPDATRKVLLCIHMDTVYGIDDPFQQCRMLDDGTMNGPGVSDAKGGLIVMLHALQALEASPVAKNIGWEVLINPDEEIGSPGSRFLIDDIAQRCDFGLLFEPALAGDQLVSWRKGSGNFTFIVRGKSAHAGRAMADGRNAVVAAAKLALALDGLNVQPDITYNVAKLEGGDAFNVVPDFAMVRLNVRVRTPEQQQVVETTLEKVVAHFDAFDGINVTTQGSFRSPPKPITPPMQQLMDRIESCARVLGKDVQWQGTGGACDGNKFAAAGLANIDSLGPSGGRIHSDEEFLVLESLVPAAKLAALTLLSYADGVHATD
jgi:glutamate carboxypeptidase